MKFYKHIGGIFLFSVSILFAQTKDSNVNNSIKYENPSFNSLILISDNYRDSYLLSIPVYLNIDTYNFSYYPYCIKTNLICYKGGIKENQFAQSKKELYRILNIKYQERDKYNLGEVGMYLGITKDMAAILLAILSIL